MTHSAHGPADNADLGLTIRRAARYDLLVWALTLGGERRLRRRILDLATLRPGEWVLDIGCGTGTLAIMATPRVGAAGAVHGLDPSPEMLARAAAKAKRAGVDLTLSQGGVQTMPYPDASFDVILSSFMLHHVPEAARRRMASEIRRVLKPQGRAILVDFGPSPSRGQHLGGHFHSHGFVQIDEIAADLEAIGFRTASGPLGEKGLDFIVAGTDENLTTFRFTRAAMARHDHVPMALAVVALLLAGVVIALHVGAAAAIVARIRTLQPVPTAAVVGAIALLILAKLTLFGTAHRFARKLLAKWVGADHDHP
jgi:ubiquinone/menaquinone biosynthesis C-methylase UbiE